MENVNDQRSGETPEGEERWAKYAFSLEMDDTYVM